MFSSGDDKSFVDFLTDMEESSSFPVRFIDSDDPENHNKIDFNEKQFNVLVKSIVYAPKVGGLQITILIDGGAPDGIIPGTYELVFRDGDCDKLPEKMFEDAEIEKEEKPSEK